MRAPARLATTPVGDRAGRAARSRAAMLAPCGHLATGLFDIDIGPESEHTAQVTEEPTARLEPVVVDLYGLPPAEFTAARNAQATQLRADGHRATAAHLSTLRRPTTAAWLVNLLVRGHPAEV